MTARPLSRYLQVLLFLLVFTVPLRSVALFELPGANLRVPDLVVLFGAVVMLVDWLLRGGRLRLGSMDRLLWLFVGYIGISVLWSLDPVFGAVRAFKFARSMIFYLLIVQALERDYVRSVRIIAAGLAGSFGYILPVVVHTFSGNSELSLQALANVQLATSGALNVLRRDALGGGTFAGTVNTLAMWANVGMFLLLGTGWWRSARWVGRAGFWLALAALVGVQIVTLSRGVWLGMAAGGLWWLWRLRGSLRFPPWAYAVGLLVLVGSIRWLEGQGLGRLIVSRLETATEVEADRSITQRFMFWQGALEAFAERPVGGVGMGGGTVVAAENGYKDWFVHNVYIQLLYELGLVGFTLWTLVMGWWLARAFRPAGRTLDWSCRVHLAALQGVTISLLVMSLTNNDFTEFEFWIVMAMVAALPSRGPMPHVSPASGPALAATP